MHLRAFFLCLCLLLGGCAAESKPARPEKAGSSLPHLTVWDVDREELLSLDTETYVAGVLAGEMAGDWPQEALKAQAVLARTFVMKFVGEKESRYPGADISTDIREAQAYAPEKINDRILQAVRETQGQVLSFQGKLPYAWFHAHSGGLTASAKEGLDYSSQEPGYTRIAPGNESDQAPENAREWEAHFDTDAFLNACTQTGVSLKALKSVKIGETGPSGRAVTLLVNGQPVNASRLRIALGSQAMRSTLLTRLTLEETGVSMAGKGYGHGVGMSQWGAHALALSGADYRQIINAYFDRVEIVSLW